MPMYRVTIPGTTFEGTVCSEEVNLDALVVKLFRTTGGKMTSRNGIPVPTEKTAHLFPKVAYLGETADYHADRTAFWAAERKAA